MNDFFFKTELLLDIELQNDLRCYYFSTIEKDSDITNFSARNNTSLVMKMHPEYKFEGRHKEFVNHINDANVKPAVFLTRKIPDNLASRCLEYIPENILSKETPALFYQVITGGDTLLPHVDTYVHRRTNLNFYLDTYGEQTNFYSCELDPIVFRSFRVGKRKVPLIKAYHPNELKLEASFIANPQDCYLLNVMNIHAVTNIQSEKKRLSVSFGFKKRYEDILEWI